MAEKETELSITIGGTQYPIDLNDLSSLTTIPWKDRKMIIEVLEKIKQAEHIQPEPKRAPESMPTKRSKPVVQDSQFKNSNVIKSNEDPDAIMQQLIIQQQNQHNIPDKSTVVKWMLVVFIIIMLLMIVL
jgi:hypothetical protein